MIDPKKLVCPNCYHIGLAKKASAPIQANKGMVALNVDQEPYILYGMLT